MRLTCWLMRWTPHQAHGSSQSPKNHVEFSLLLVWWCQQRGASESLRSVLPIPEATQGTPWQTWKSQKEQPHASRKSNFKPWYRYYCLHYSVIVIPEDMQKNFSIFNVLLQQKFFGGVFFFQDYHLNISIKANFNTKLKAKKFNFFILLSLILNYAKFR